MPQFDDRHASTRLYVGHLSSRTRSRDLEDLFSRYGRVRDVDLKREFAFVEFSDSRDADDARHDLNGRDFVGSRIIVEFAKGAPRGSGGSREFIGRGPPPGSGRCFNCGLDGHWARDCKSGDWKNKCYRCGERGHIERKCHCSPKKLKRRHSYSLSPSHSGRSRSRSSADSRSQSYSQSRSPPRRERGVERLERTSRNPRDSQSPKRHKASAPPSKHRRRSLTPDRSPQRRNSPPLRDHLQNNGSNCSSPRSPINGPRRKSRSPIDDPEGDTPRDRNYRSPVEEENGRSPSSSPIPRADRSSVGNEDDG